MLSGLAGRPGKVICTAPGIKDRVAGGSHRLGLLLTWCSLELEGQYLAAHLCVCAYVCTHCVHVHLCVCVCAGRKTVPSSSPVGKGSHCCPAEICFSALWNFIGLCLPDSGWILRALWDVGSLKIWAAISGTSSTRVRRGSGNNLLPGQGGSQPSVGPQPWLRS